MGDNRAVGVSNEIVVPVIRALEELGLSIDGLLPAASTVLAAPHLNHQAVDAGFDAAAGLLSDEALGITIASRIPVGSLGVLDYALCTSASLRDGLRRLARYYGIATQRSRLRLLEEPPRALVVVDRGQGFSYSRHVVEFSCAIIAARMRQTLGLPISFDEVAFAHEPPERSTCHDEFFGTRVLFSSPPDRLVFQSALLNLPLRTAAAALAELLETKMPELAIAAEGDALLIRAHEAVAQLLDAGDTALDSLARSLHLSRRTLQRELHTRSTSHRAVLDAVRRERALALLSAGAANLDEVAARLGFRETSAFYRAFRRWTGTSPGAFRAAGG